MNTPATPPASQLMDDEAPCATPQPSRGWMVPAVVLACLVLAAVLAPWVTPQNPYALEQLRLEDSVLAPVWVRPALAQGSAQAQPFYLLGTDAQGRDMLSAVIYGLRVSLLVGLGGTALAMVLGVGLGLAAGWWRGMVDGAIMRVADIQLAFPSVLIALFMMAIWGQGLGKLIVAVGVVHWVVYARTVRGCVLVEREKDYISAIRALGGGALRILGRHLLPNVSGPVLVISAVEFASVVMLEAMLSFLGLGVPITRPSLGMLINFGYNEVFSGAWWISLWPGLALVALVLSLNLLADHLRARLEPAGQ